MSIQSTSRDKNEKRSIHPLLVSRKDTAVMLGGVDISTIRRLEKEGLLIPKRLNPRSPTAQVFYSYENVLAVAQGEGATNA
jgi:hypothetical protein